MRRHGKSRVAVGLLFLLLLTLLAGCSTEREHSFKVSQDWSRGIRLGITSFRQPVALAADEAGAYMVWPVKGEETTLLQYAHLGPDGLLLGSGPLDVDLIFPKLPRLVAGDNLHLFLVTRQTSAELPGAYGVVLNRDGQVLNDLARLSNPEQRVDHMAEVQSPQGEIHLLWDVIEGPGTGVYHAQVQPDGTLTGFPQLVWPGGIQPAATVAEDGTVHMAWMQQINPSRYNLYYRVTGAGRDAQQRSGRGGSTADRHSGHCVAAHRCVGRRQHLHPLVTGSPIGSRRRYGRDFLSRISQRGPIHAGPANRVCLLRSPAALPGSNRV